MTYPVGVATATVTFGPYEGNGSVVFTATPLVWAATGAVVLADPLTEVLDYLGSGSIVLPVDQAGFTNGSSSVRDWTYRAIIRRDGHAPDVRTFALPEAYGGTTVDLDLLTSVASSSGTQVALPQVISVDGDTGAINTDATTAARVGDTGTATGAALAGTFAAVGASWADVPPSLHVLDAAIAKRSYAACTIIGLGDSLFESLTATTYAASIPGRMGAALRTRYAQAAQGGAGFIPAAWPTEGASDAPQDMIPATTGTVTKATGATAAIGMGRKSIQMSAAATITFKTQTCTGFDIVYAGVISSAQSYTYSVDGGAPVSVSTSTTRTTLTASNAIGDSVLAVAAVPADWYPGVQLSVEASGGQIETAYIQSIAGLNVTLKSTLTKTHASGVPVAAHGNGGYIKQVRGLSSAPHVVTIAAVTTSTIEGIRYYDNDETSGIHWLNAGHGGIRADQLVPTGNGDHSLKTIAAMAPKAVFCNLIINDSGVQTPATMITNLTALRTAVNAAMVARGLATPSWVQVIPYEVAVTRYLSATWASYVDAINAWAKADTTGPGGASGIFVVDLGRRMPRSDLAVGTLYNADLVHPLDAGCAQFVELLTAALPIQVV